MKGEYRRPHPTLLDYITPTQVVEGDKCLWRIGFDQDPMAMPLRRSNPASALGAVTHEVMRRLGEPAPFDSVWCEAVSKAHSKLLQDWEPASVPSPESWPGWSLTKVRMRKLWQRSTGTSTATTSREHPPSGGGGQKLSLPWRERWLRHPFRRVAGRPDLVERVRDAIWVIDFKTGLKQAEPTVDQHTQLLIYCGLVEAALGQRPTHAAIQTANGERYDFPVDWGDVGEVIDRAESMLQRLNASVTDGLSEADAAPSPETCAWCAFRPACRPFFDAYDETWPIPHALLFEVQSAELSPHGYSLKAVVKRPHWRRDEEIHVLGFPFTKHPSRGELWGAINFAGRASSAVASWNTTVFNWT